MASMEIQKAEVQQIAFRTKRPVIENGAATGRFEVTEVPVVSSGIVDLIFAKMAVRYGSDWSMKWAGLKGDEKQALSDDWAKVLAGLDLKAIKWGLDNLPDGKPPIVTEFKSICRRWPGAAITEEPVRNTNSKIPKNIAEKLRAIVERNASEKSEVRAAEMRKRLGLQHAALSSVTPIDESLLPPGMREAIGKPGGIRYHGKR